MKKITLFFSLLSLVIVCNLAHTGEIPQSGSSNVEIQDNVVLPFFAALRNGDVNAIKRYISSDMYSTYKRLLEDNKEYPKFLRDYYRDAKFHVERTNKVDDRVEFDVVIEFPDGNRSINKLRVLKKRGRLQDRSGSNNWEIANQTVGSAQNSSEKVSSPE